MMDNHMLVVARELPKAGEKWRQYNGRHYLIQGLSRHVDTGETFVVCRSLAAPSVSLAHPVSTFMGTLGQESPEPRFQRVDED
jgi:hypothetical protein